MKLWRWLILSIASIYLIALIGIAATLRLVGERWWVSGVALYLPRPLFAAPLPFVLAALAAVGARRAFWAYAASSALVVLFMMGFVPPRPVPRSAGAPVMRVLSYNISSGVGGIDKVVAEIDRYSPDLVLLQEVGQIEPLTAAMRRRYPTVEVSDQFLLATRYRVLAVAEPERILYGGRLRSPRFVRQILQTPLGRIAVYNVHPISPREAFYALRGAVKHDLRTRRLPSEADGAAFRVNSGLRSLQVQAFAEAAAQETDPVLIAGDTNLPGLSWVLRRNLSSYEDAFAQAGWGLGYTFPANRRPWMRIDRILASPPLRFVRFEVGESLASDHHCVVADLQRSDARP